MGLISTESTQGIRLLSPGPSSRNNTELLEALAADFREHNYSMHRLMKMIMKSNAYQLSAKSTVGLFINTLPMRVSLPPDQPLREWLWELQEHNAELRQFESTPAGWIRQWAGAPAALPLYESLLVFENFPREIPADPTLDGAAVEVSEVRSSGGRTGFALTLIVQPDAELALRLMYDNRRVDEAGARTIAGHAVRLLRRMPAAADSPLRSLLTCIAPEEVPPIRRASPPTARAAAAGEAPEDPIAEVMAALWAQVLGVERVGLEEDFFQLGGHSLAAAELVMRVREAFELELPLRCLFEARTVSAMAAEIARRKGRESPATTAALPRIVPDPAHRDEPFPRPTSSTPIGSAAPVSSSSAMCRPTATRRSKARDWTLNASAWSSGVSSRATGCCARSCAATDARRFSPRYRRSRSRSST